MSTRWEQVKRLSPAAFRRLTGVKEHTFAAICAVLYEHERSKKKPDRPPALGVEDQLLLKSFGLRLRLLAGLHNFGLAPLP